MSGKRFPGTVRSDNGTEKIRKLRDARSEAQDSGPVTGNA